MIKNYERVIAKDVCDSAQLTEWEQQCVKDYLDKLKRKYRSRKIWGVVELIGAVLLLLHAIWAGSYLIQILLAVVLVVQSRRSIRSAKHYCRSLNAFYGGFKGTVVQKDFQIENTEVLLRVAPKYRYKLMLSVGEEGAVDNVLCDEKRIYESAAVGKSMLVLYCSDGSMFAF